MPASPALRKSECLLHCAHGTTPGGAASGPATTSTRTRSITHASTDDPSTPTTAKITPKIRTAAAHRSQKQLETEDSTYHDISDSDDPPTVEVLILFGVLSGC